MEDLSTALFYDTVPETWVARAYPSMMGLAAWYSDLLQRIRVSLRDPGTSRSLCAMASASSPASPSDEAGMTSQEGQHQRSECIKPRGVPQGYSSLYSKEQSTTCSWAQGGASPCGCCKHS